MAKALTHQECGVRLVPSSEPGMVVLLNPMTDQTAKVPRGTELKFNESGWGNIAYAIEGGLTKVKQWVKMLLPASACRSSDGQIFMGSSGGSVQWRHKQQLKYATRFPIIAAQDDKEDAPRLTVHVTDANIKGMTAWWDIRFFQECRWSFFVSSMPFCFFMFGHEFHILST